MEIIKGKLPGAKKTVVYGPEGIGKSTFAARFPDPLFIDTEGSTKDMDVARTLTPSSWTMLLGQITYIRDNPSICKTLVVDTINWAEQMCVEHICSLHQKKGVEDFGYGKGYVYVKEEFGRFLNHLTEVIKAGVNVVLTAHTQIKKFTLPDEMGDYDRYELKLGQKTQSQTSPLVKEWADMLLFANYKTYSVAVDDKGKKHKAQGGKRVMYTSHHPCWDAKNRYGLSDEVPFEYGSIAHIIGNVMPPAQPKQEPTAQQQPIPASGPAKQEPPTPPPVQQSIPEETQQMELPLGSTPVSDTGTESFPPQDPRIPKALRDLMEINHVDEWELQSVVSARGYYPPDVPIRDYDTEFINGCLIGAWGQVHNFVKEMRQKQEIPFN